MRIKSLEVQKALHTGRGVHHMKNIACLVSYHDDPKRKLKYDVETVSLDNPEESDKNWVGINLILSNRLVEFLLRTHRRITWSIDHMAGAPVFTFTDLFAPYR